MKRTMTAVSVAMVAAVALTAQTQRVPIIMDGHVHITNRVYWENIDPWKPQPVGPFDYARAWDGGANVVIENLGSYGYEDYNATVKQVGRLIETFHRTLAAHRDRMELALTSADVRRIAASGKMAVLLGIESGFDQDGDVDILRLWHRLGVRSIVFTSHQSNAYADSVMAGGEHWGGINDRGRQLIAEMNRLGMLIDISHGTDAARRQIIAASRAPVVASHVGLKSVANRALNIPDDVAVALAAKGGLVGVTSVASMTTQRYMDWTTTHKSPDTGGGITPGPDWTMQRRRAPDYGEYANAFDAYMRQRWLTMWGKPWHDDPAAPVPTVDDWADHVARVVSLIGADHVGIGLDLWQGRSHLEDWDARGYRRLAEALRARQIPTSVLGENWLRVLDASQAP
jgi:membrane dipeptidase